MSDELSQYTSVLDIPWFMEVSKKSDEYLDSVYQTHPELCPSWYIEYRKNNND